MAAEDYFVFRDQGRTFQDIGIYAETDTDRDVNVTGFAEPERVHALNVTDGALSVLGIPPMLGRIFSLSDDSPGAPPTAVLSYAYWHRKLSADPAAVGKTIVVDGRARQIIGVMPRHCRFLDLQDLALILPLQLDRAKTRLVAGDVRDDGMDKPARTDVYWPTLLARFQGRPLQAKRHLTFIVRSPLAGSASFLNQVRQAVWAVDRNLPLARVYTLDHFYAGSMARASFTLAMLGLAGIMALVLGTVGLYGVIAYAVSQRTRELGIRMALGARRGDLLSLVLGEGMLVILGGLAVGLAGALALTRFLSSLLVGVTATDPLTFAAVAVALALVALAACYVPRAPRHARRSGARPAPRIASAAAAADQISFRFLLHRLREALWRRE